MMAVHSFALTAALLLLLLSLASPATSCSEQETGSLLQFLAGLSQHDGLSASWRENGADCCNWEGITCSADDGTVIEVFLASRGLEGSISPSLADLTNLQRLNLSYNSFSGDLPWQVLVSSNIVVLDVSFNHLSRVLQQDNHHSSSVPHRRPPPLQVLNISSNLFTGQFPSILWESKSNLVVLNVSNNSFQGWMPSPSFCISSSSFAMLDLSCNQFSGRIPPGLGNCSALKVVKAGHNQITGMLPDELFNASSLEHLSFPNNGLLGILDGARIVSLKNLAILDLGGNRLNGKIPDTIGKLKRLEELHLDDNDMFGGLPSALSNCTNLITIDLRRNSFGRELTRVNFTTLINLKRLDLFINNFTGTIPQSIYSCSNLNTLRLAGNNLHGQLSPRIANLKSLVFLSLASNHFMNITNTLHVLKDCKNLTFLSASCNFKGDDAIPEDGTIDGFKNLQFLSISGCISSGKIPLWLSKLKSLRVLSLSRNNLSGTIPFWIKTLKSLSSLDLSDNNLAGEIPTSLMGMRTTTHLDPRVFGVPVYKGPLILRNRITSDFPNTLNLSNNNFTGVIPPEIGQLKSLDVLDLSSNSLSGEIPRQLSSLMNLQLLDLSNNRLTGAIPSDLNKLHFLSAFNISNNDFEGSIPTGGQFSTFTSSSFGGNPKLCGAIADRPCGSAKTPLVPSLYAEQKDRSFGFAIAFGAFFGVGVLYDQIVFSKYFG